MSATNRGGQRIHADFYETPDWCTRRILERLWNAPHFASKWQLYTKWHDPCAGDGAIIRPASNYVSMSAAEIRPECKESLWRAGASSVVIDDFLRPTSQQHYDVILTNPPYSRALEFVIASLARATHVIMLLRLNFLASQKRNAFFSNNMPDIYCLSDRPSFTGSGTDATEYAWFHWGSTHPKHTGLIEMLPLTSDMEKKAWAAEQAYKRLLMAPTQSGTSSAIMQPQYDNSIDSGYIDIDVDLDEGQTYGINDDRLV